MSDAEDVVVPGDVLLRHVFGRISGVSEANRVARHLVVAPQHVGQQPQLTEQPVVKSSADRKTTGCLETLRVDPNGIPSLDKLVAQVGVSCRSLTKRNPGADWWKSRRLAVAHQSGAQVRCECVTLAPSEAL